MTTGIYGIFDAKTDECLYIGLSQNIEQRWRSHLKELRSKSHKRQDFVEWYHANGAKKELLVFRVLEECDDSELNNAEIIWFHKMSPKYFGQSPSLRNKMNHSDETKRRIGEKVRESQLKNAEQRDCVCGNSFTTYAKSNKMYCSVECREKSRAKKEKKPSKYFPKDHIFVCSYEQCRRNFSLGYPVLIESNRGKFCSKDCSYHYWEQDKGLNKESVQECFDEGLSLRQMAVKFDCSHQTIKNFMKKNNIVAKS